MNGFNKMLTRRSSPPHMKAMSMIVVKAGYDDEAAVWFVESSDLPGLNVEAASIEEFRARIEAAAVDLLQESDRTGEAFDIPIEIIAHASARARVPSAA